MVLNKKTIIGGSVLLVLVTCHSENTPPVALTSIMESDRGGSESIHNRGVSNSDTDSFRLPSTSSTNKLINRWKRNSPPRKVEENVPRILNRNTAIISSDTGNLKTSVQSSFSNRDNRNPDDKQAGFVPSKFIPSKPISFQPNFRSL